MPNKIGIRVLMFIIFIHTTSSWCHEKSFPTSNEVLEVDYSPDGTKIVTAEVDRLRLYSATTYL
jgi:WD40 repeat protein